MQVDNPELARAIRTFVRILGRTTEKLTDERIQRLAEAIASLETSESDIEFLAQTAALRSEYLKTVPTCTAAELHKLAGHEAKNAAETASGWTREGRIFSVRNAHQVGIPIFQISECKPRPEIARVLAELPNAKRSSWGAAFWFASGSQRLGCAPQDAILDPSRVEEVIDLARRSATVVG
ncbi:hypothetical protein [Frigidibacter sp. MR17.24]|uniref:hypothetical protein n=1 Tax=Frigidibacter sp. MR17.24 TaxID=3127345 RepID=UPI003012B475